MSSTQDVIVKSIFIDRYALLGLEIVNLIIGPFLIHVIVTKSKILGTFKWYLLNQTVFVQIFEFFIILLNPVLLNPYLSGFMSGILGPFIPYEGTLAICCICFCLLANMIVAVCLSVTNRFFFMFRPDFRKYLENKYTMCCLIGCHLSAYALVCVLFLVTATSPTILRQIAHNESSGLLDIYFDEPSLIYVSKYDVLPRMPFCTFIINKSSKMHVACF
uniref:G protein-coupled receptor n=1 Tax=Panagrellus redivivus TaxID=6233 RepID=A0A7E4W161_PANRE